MEPRNESLMKAIHRVGGFVLFAFLLSIPGDASAECRKYAVSTGILCPGLGYNSFCECKWFFCDGSQVPDAPTCGNPVPGWPCVDICSTYDGCTGLPEKDACDGYDGNSNGCINDGCPTVPDPLQPQCACTKQCQQPSCIVNPVATCEPEKNGDEETCSDNLDNNCDGLVDEDCDPPPDDPPPPRDPPPPTPPGGCTGEDCPRDPRPKEDECGNKVGADPILLSTRSAATTPFTDFSVESVVRLGITRSYSSADASIVAGGAPGIFGKGWHHDWEVSLTCSASAPGFCTLNRGLQAGMRFKKSGTAPPPAAYAGDTAWDVYTRSDSDVLGVGDRSILIRRPNAGEFILFLTDGRELHLDKVCDCGATCADATAGGRARLVKVVDAAGNRTTVSYDWAGGTLLALKDDLGHTLALKNPNACSERIARELWYGDPAGAFAKYVTYSYLGNLLQDARDSDGNVLRAYDYDSAGRILFVRNEQSDPIAEFGYDANGHATSLVDPLSTVTVEYPDASTARVISASGSAAAATSERRRGSQGEARGITAITGAGGTSSMAWNGRRLRCVQDPLGRVDWYEHDAEARITRHARFAPGTYTCYTATSPSVVSPPPTATPLEDEYYTYGDSRAVAQGVSAPLDRMTGLKRRSALADKLTGAYAADPYSYVTYDYDQSAKAGDPAGWNGCGAAGLPAGSVLCRRVEQGYTLDATGQPVVERHATYYAHDSRGRLTQTIGPVNLDRPWPGEVVPTEVRTYWGDAESRENRGRLRSISRYPGNGAAALVTTAEYDAIGAYRVTDPNGVVTTTLKDSRGRARYRLLAGNQVSEVRYYDGLEPALHLRAGGSALRYTYDDKGRARLVEALSGDPDAGPVVVGWTEQRTFDPAGNVATVEWLDTAGVVRRRQVRESDEEHRLRREIHPGDAAAVATWDYDATGLLKYVTDEESRKTEFIPDDLRRTRTVRKTGRDAAGLPASLDVATYDFEPAQGSLAKVTDGAARATSYTADDFGRQLTVDNPATFKSTPYRYSMDTRGNRVRRTGGSVTIDWTYDGLDRLTKVAATSSIGGPAITYVYSYDHPGDLGRLHSITHLQTGRVVTYAHDAEGRTTFETVAEGGVTAPLVTEYRHDADGDVDTLVYPSGLSLKLVRDPATKEVTEVRNLATGVKYAGNVTHWPQGPVKGLTFSNGITLSQTFNLRYEPTGITSGPLALTFTPAKAGGFTAIQVGAALSTYGRDFLDRLVSVTPATGAPTYTFTYAGDRVKEAWTVEQVPKRKFAFGYDDQTNLSAVSVYDSAGTRTTSTTCLVHDALNRLIVVGPARFLAAPDAIACRTEADVSTVQVRFQYDAQHRRVARRDGAAAWKQHVLGPDGSPLSELTRPTTAGGAWTPLRDYVWLDGKPLAQLEYPGPQAYALHVDHLGLPRAMTSSTGATIWSATTRPYGDLVESSSTGVVTNLRLPGQYDERLLAGIGIQGPYYNWHRWYLPMAGRYLELDPIALDGEFNGTTGPDWFGYAGGSPLLKTDPGGLLDTYTECLKKYKGCLECCGPGPGNQPPLPNRAPPFLPWLPWPQDPQPDKCAPKKDGGSCSCQHRDVFSSGGVSCQALREAGVCSGPYKGNGSDTASCQANARENAPEACKGCLGHCLFRSG